MKTIQMFSSRSKVHIPSPTIISTFSLLKTFSLTLYDSHVDVNDNPPIFDRPSYQTTIVEGDDKKLPKKILQVIVFNSITHYQSIISLQSFYSLKLHFPPISLLSSLLSSISILLITHQCIIFSITSPL